MNSKLMNYIYKNKFKSTKKVFSEIQARSVKELPIINTSAENETLMVDLVNQILDKESTEQIELENKINELVYELYDLSEEEINIIEEANA